MSVAVFGQWQLLAEFCPTAKDASGPEAATKQSYPKSAVDSLPGGYWSKTQAQSTSQFQEKTVSRVSRTVQFILQLLLDTSR